MPYKAGDWIRYSYMFKRYGGECTATIYVRVDEANYPYVNYSVKVEKTEGDHTICPWGQGYEFSMSINVTWSRPESSGPFLFFVDPSYTGEINLYGVGRVCYVNGVLKSWEVKQNGPAGVVEVSASVVDSSMGFLKPFPTDTLSQNTLSQSLLLVAVVIVAVAMVAVVLFRKRKIRVTISMPLSNPGP